MALDWLTRSIRPPDVTPNPNDPVTAAPGTVGPPSVNPGDPNGVTFEGEAPPWQPPPRIMASAWSGWPAEWWPPNWGHANRLVNTAWICVDLNANLLSTMPPYLVRAAPTLDSGWLQNPNPALYYAWEEFAKQLVWDFLAVGEAFVVADAYYATGWPAQFHVVPPYLVEAELGGDGRRRYRIGKLDVTGGILHLRYKSSVDDARGHGPLEAMGAKLVAAELLNRYATTLASSGLVPSSILEAPDEMSPDQAGLLRDQWVQQRLANPGFPAVLSGGLKWTPTQLDPEKMALLDLQRFNEAQIAVALHVQPNQVGLPSGGDSLTYNNQTSLFDYHWRSGLRPLAQQLMAGLSGWLLPRQTRIELNRDEYVQPGPYERAQTAAILAAIVDPVTGQQALTVDEIRAAERLDNSTPTDLAQGVLQ